MRDFSPACAVASLPDIELEGQISCARQRLVRIAPGFTEPVARPISHKWHQLGTAAVQVVVDPDPEVCRLGSGDMKALALLHATAAELGVRVHQRRRGLRIGVVITGETTTIYAPVPRLIEAGGQPGERLNALRLDAPVHVGRLDPGVGSASPIKIEVTMLLGLEPAVFRLVLEFHGSHDTPSIYLVPSPTRLCPLIQLPFLYKVRRSTLALLRSERLCVRFPASGSRRERRPSWAKKAKAESQTTTS